MLKIKLTHEETTELLYWKVPHPHAKKKKKMSVLYLKSQKLTHKEIKRLERISENTLLKYLNEYMQPGGLENLKKICFYRPKSAMEEHADILRAYFLEHPPASSNEAAAMIEKLTGIKRTPDRARVFMKKLGMNIRKVGMIPAKADAAAQDNFLKEELEPRLQEARKGKRTLFL